MAETCGFCGEERTLRRRLVASTDGADPICLWCTERLYMTGMVGRKPIGEGIVVATHCNYCRNTASRRVLQSARRPVQICEICIGGWFDFDLEACDLIESHSKRYEAVEAILRDLGGLPADEESVDQVLKIFRPSAVPQQSWVLPDRWRSLLDQAWAIAEEYPEATRRDALLVALRDLVGRAMDAGAGVVD